MDEYSHLPPDVADDKRTANQLRRDYKHKAFGALRLFLALKRSAPGVIAESALGGLLSIAGLLIAFHDLNAKGIFEVAAVCIAFVLIIAVGFVVAGWIWRSIPVRVRDMVRFFVQNAWASIVTASLIVGLFVQLISPLFDRATPPATLAEQQPLPAPTQAPAVPAATAPRTHVLPVAERAFAGQGWRILQATDSDYLSVNQIDAVTRCEALEGSWALADRWDYETLIGRLVRGGHAGSFWAESTRPTGTLVFTLRDDASHRFRWEPDDSDDEVGVMCIESPTAAAASR